MSNLQPTPITDKNGKQTTVHKKPVATPNKRAGAAAAPKSAVENTLTPETQKFVQRIGTKFRKNDDNSVVTLTSVEDTGYTNYNDEALYRATFTDGDGNELSIATGSSLAGFTGLKTDPYYKSAEAFNPTDTSRLAYHMGTPFTASSVSDLMVYGKDRSTRYPTSSFPILTSFGTTMDLESGESGMRLEFSQIEGETISIEVPPSNFDSLRNVYLQPLRRKWQQYDPDTLR